jgi:hypothetical protein
MTFVPLKSAAPDRHDPHARHNPYSFQSAYCRQRVRNLAAARPINVLRQQS